MTFPLEMDYFPWVAKLVFLMLRKMKGSKTFASNRQNVNHVPWMNIRRGRERIYFRRQLLLSFCCVKLKSSLA